MPIVVFWVLIGCGCDSWCMCVVSHVANQQAKVPFRLLVLLDIHLPLSLANQQDHRSGAPFWSSIKIQVQL